MHTYLVKIGYFNITNYTPSFIYWYRLTRCNKVFITNENDSNMTIGKYIFYLLACPIKSTRLSCWRSSSVRDCCASEHLTDLVSNPRPCVESTKCLYDLQIVVSEFGFV